LSEQLADLAADAARLAGALLLERAERGAESAVSSKSTPTDLVSEADLAAQQAIRELLSARRPDDGFLGEEGGDEPGSSGLRWIVDPLDGTVNFLFGIPQWSVSVAVADADGALAGAVYDPNRNELFTATRGGPARLSAPGGESELRGRAADPRGGGGLSTAMVSTGLAYDAGVRERQAQVLARLAGQVRDIRRLGSAALDLAWTAAGRYDAYFERTVKPWDIAAGELICRSAGLGVRELGEQEGLPWGILVAPAHLLGELAEIVG
jgi:myo-inositol-1(or 4)-monophosphatase